MKFSMIFEAQVEFGTPDVERRGDPQLRRASGLRGGDGLRRRLGGRAPLARRVLAHERARDLPHRRRGADVAHPRRARGGVHAVRLQPPRARRRARRHARHHLRRPAQPRRRARRHRAGDVAVRRRSRADTTPQVEEALRFIGHCWREDTIEWDSELLKIQPPPGRPPHTVVPRPVQIPHPPLFLACTNPETVRRAAQYGVGPMVLGFGGPEMIGEMRRMFDEERATRDPDAVVSPGDDQRRVRRALPDVPAWTTARRRCASAPRALRFFAEAITHWAAPNGVAPARRHRQVDNVAFMKEHLAAAHAGHRARRRAADRGIVALQHRPRARRRRHRDRRTSKRLAARRRRQRDVPHPDGHAHPGPACWRPSASSASR